MNRKSQNRMPASSSMSSTTLPSKRTAPLSLVLTALLTLSACGAPADDQARQNADKGAEDATPSAAAPATAPDAQAATGSTSTPSSAPAPLPERPELKIATLNGDTFQLSERRGRWVVLNFWATWCAPCLKEMPELSRYDTARDDVDMIGLAYEEIEAAEMRSFLETHPVDYPIAIIDTYDPPADFATPRGLPMTYVIAPDGKVAKQFMGPVTGADLDAIIGAAQSGTGTAAQGG